MKLRQLACSGLILLVLTLIWLGTPTLTRVLEERSTAASIRANLVTAHIAQQIGNALQMGVPLSQLEGVDELFAQHCKRHPDVISISFMDASGTVLHRYRVRDTGDAATANAEVRDAKQLRGHIELRYTASSNTQLIMEIGALLTAVSVLGGILSMLFLQYAAETGPLARDRATARLCQAIQNGQTDIRLTGFQRRDFDKRPQWLSRRILSVHESRTRLSRMLNSLTATEPTAEGRARLHALGQASEACFAATSGSLKRFTALGSEELRRYPLLLLGAALAALRFPLLSGDSAGRILGLSWLLLGGGLWLMQRFLKVNVRWARFAPSGYFAIAAIALIPMPFLLRLAAASAIAIALLASTRRTGENLILPLLLGEIIGLLAGALLVRLSPDAPLFFSAAAALIGMRVCQPLTQPPPTGASDTSEATGEITPPPRGNVRTEIYAGLGVGFTLTLALGALRDFSFVSVLPLTVALIAVISDGFPLRTALARTLMTLAFATTLFCLANPQTEWQAWLTPSIVWLSMLSSRTAMKASHANPGAALFWIAMTGGAAMALTGSLLGLTGMGHLTLAAAGALALSLWGRFRPEGA